MFLTFDVDEKSPKDLDTTIKENYKEFYWKDKLKDDPMIEKIEAKYLEIESAKKAAAGEAAAGEGAAGEGAAKQER